MNKHMMLKTCSKVLFLLVALPIHAVNIPAGMVYFDNSKTQYSHVQFIYGYDSQQLSYVQTMTYDGEKWAVTIPQTVTDIYRYTFSDTQLSDGEYNETFSDLKEYISKTLVCNRTATTDQTITTEYIYVPTSGDNWAQGSWKSLKEWQSKPIEGQSVPSGTLPILYINTEGGKAIDSKETYVSATYYLLDTIGGQSIGSQESPNNLSIKGRGNYTWTGFDKKPYRIKLESGQKVLGMKKNKHWALMAAADDNLGFLRNPAGYMLSEAMGLRWTPSQQPVELVLNGKYEGLYFWTEIIRVDKDRINIEQQEENITDPDSITGGWLVEIDNYREEGNVEFYEGNGQYMMITIKDPEVLSTAQRTYIEQQLNGLNTAFYESTSTHWEQLVDLDEAVRYYIVQEIMEDCESYHGSCYLYKDMDKAGVLSKWYWGAVWDFGNAYNRHQNKFIYVDPIWPQYWIGQIASFPSFQKRVRELWNVFYRDEYEGVCDSIEALGQRIRYAAANDAERWKNSSNVQTNADMVAKTASFLNNMQWRVNWLEEQWGNMTAVEEVSSVPSASKRVEKDQIVIYHDGKKYSILGTER